MENRITAAAEGEWRGRSLTSRLVTDLKIRFGDRISLNMSDCDEHGHDNSPFVDVSPPEAVLFAESIADVVELVRFAENHQIPIIPFGVGSSVEGHVLAVQGGISLDLRRMNKILAIDTDDMTATVQPGVTRVQLNEALESHGLFFSVDPGANASIGGMCGTRASGTNTVRYGTMRDNVLALQVVTASGDVVHTGTRARKSSAGYDLTRLLVGSEGTLGVFTEIVLRLFPKPVAMSAAVCSFTCLSSAVDAARCVVREGIPIAKMELIDANSVKMVNRYSGLVLPEKPMLVMEFHGTHSAVKEQAETVQKIANEFGGSAFEWETEPDARARLWSARHNVYFAAIASKPGSRAVSTDACVPISSLTKCMEDSAKDADRVGLPYFLVGHVGDGNFHFGYLIDPESVEERAQAEALNERLVERAIRLGGTCSGEHGIGIHKMNFLVQEIGVEALVLMQSVKRAFDPKGILNPGKLLHGKVDEPARLEARCSWARDRAIGTSPDDARQANGHC